MKAFLVPAFFVVFADSEEKAEEIAGEMQNGANAVTRHKSRDMCMLDEGQKNVEFDHKDGEELPHTFPLSLDNLGPS